MATEKIPESADGAPKKKSHRKRWIAIIVLLFFLVGGAYTVDWLLISQYYESTDDAYVAGNTVQIMPQITGHVTQILAEETGLVQKGDPVLYLDKADSVITLQNAEARLASTIRSTKQLYNNVDQLKANVALAQANLEKLQGDLARRQQLIVSNAISYETYVHSQADVKAAQASLSVAKQQLTSAITLVSNSDLYHHPDVQQAIVAVRNAYLNLARTTIYAPATGYVAKRAVQVGQEVNPNTALMVIVPIDQIWVNANFKETQLANIRIAQPVRVIADAYGNRVIYRGRVVGLSPGTGSAFDILPPQNATGNWIKIVQRLPVRIELDAKQLRTYPLRIGLSVNVQVNTHNRNGRILSAVPERKVIYQTVNFSSQFDQANHLINRIFKANATNVSYPSQ